MTDPTLAFGLVLAGILGLLAWRDCQVMRLPNGLTAALAAAGLAQAFALADPRPTEAVAACLLSATLLFSVLAAYRWGRGVDGLGLGDVKLAAGGSLWIGVAGVGPMLLIATASAGAFVALRLWRTGSFDAKARFPFGPFLSLGILSTWLLEHVPSAAQSPY